MNGKVKVPKKKINKLKTDLAGCSLKVVADRLKVTEAAIYKVLSNQSYSERIIEGCIVYRDELKKNANALSARI